MSRSLLIICLLFAFLQCKNEDIEPLQNISSIVGKWRVVEYWRTSGDSTITQTVSKEKSWVYEIRSDGIILNENGNKPCCLPPKYFLNGKEFEPKPAKKVELDPICALSLCATCPELRITQTSPDSITIETCPGYATVFIRENI